MIRGIDISTYQGNVDFARVKKAGVGFVFAKASEGASEADDRFEQYHDACKAVGIPFGAYHFLRFNVNPVEQAEHFLRTIAGREGALLPMVDVEISDGKPESQLISTTESFIATIERTLGGKKMLLYTYYGFWNDTMGGSSAFSGHPLWIAEYNDQSAPSLPAGFQTWVLWQHSSSGRVDGIEGDVDLDVLNGDDPSIIERLPAIQ